MAKGDLKQRTGQFNERFEIRLDGFSLAGVHLGTDQTDFAASPPHLGPGPSTFSLAMELTVPTKGGGGIQEPPPHRAILSVRGGSSSAIGILTNVRMFAIPADEIVVTTLEPPPFVPFFPRTHEADVPT
jgi:hypothetical protein